MLRQLVPPLSRHRSSPGNSSFCLFFIVAQSPALDSLHKTCSHSCNRCHSTVWTEPSQLGWGSQTKVRVPPVVHEFPPGSEALNTPLNTAVLRVLLLSGSKQRFSYQVGGAGGGGGVINQTPDPRPTLPKKEKSLICLSNQQVSPSWTVCYFTAELNHRWFINVNEWLKTWGRKWDWREGRKNFHPRSEAKSCK